MFYMCINKMPTCVEFSPSPIHLTEAPGQSVLRVSAMLRHLQDLLHSQVQLCLEMKVQSRFPGICREVLSFVHSLSHFFSVIGKGLGWVITSTSSTCCLKLPYIKTLIISAWRYLSAVESALFYLFFRTLLTVTQNIF